jgi:hypothetical protein
MRSNDDEVEVAAKPERRNFGPWGTRSRTVPAR